MEQINPLFDQVLVQLAKPPEKTSHGLYVADDKKAATFRGVVLAVGPGIDGKPVSVNEGDTVVFGRMHSGQEIKVNGEDGYLLMGERDLLATISTTEGK